MKSLIIIFGIYLILEIIIFVIIRNLKFSKWIITKNNLFELFNKVKFLKFKKTNYSLQLGWDKKPNYKNFETNKRIKTFYSINSKGYRNSKFDKRKNAIATFGDSYTFCRQVNDTDTWQEIISRNKKIFVSNYGVGNYGLDQAYLKFNFKFNKINCKEIIFGIVPETICRVQSSWKNYLEFGNLHGFKPYCEYKNNNILIHPNPLKKNSTFKDIKNIIALSKQKDRFYKDKYLKYCFKFPFIISFFHNFTFNIDILSKYLFVKKKELINFDETVFPIVMNANIKLSHRLYNETYSRNLMKKLFEKINKDLLKKKIKCHFVIFPQLFDLKLSTRVNYQDLYKGLSNKMNIIDLTNSFLQKKNFEKLFTNDKYGGHLNKKGNIFVANIIQKKLN